LFKISKGFILYLINNLDTKKTKISVRIKKNELMKNKHWPQKCKIKSNDTTLYQKKDIFAIDLFPFIQGIGFLIFCQK